MLFNIITGFLQPHAGTLHLGKTSLADAVWDTRHTASAAHDAFVRHFLQRLRTSPSPALDQF